MNRSLLSLAGIVGAASLAYYLGTRSAAQTTSGITGSSGHLAVMIAALCCFLFLYIGLADAQIKHDALQDKTAQSEQQPKFAAELDRLSEALASLKSSASPKLTTNDNASLTEAVGVLAKDLAAREKESARLLDIIKRKESRNALARLATIRETAEFTRRINAAGKLDDKEALRQLIQEIDAAFEDLGLEILHIAPGSRVVELPSGSFSVVSSADAETSALAGTVKESLSDAVFLKDDGGKPVFISPAKLRVYRL